MTAAAEARPPTSDGALPAPGPDASATERAVWAALDRVEDPHLPAGLVELGMVHAVDVADGHARVEMTYPCLGCPAYDFIQDDVRDAAASVAGVRSVQVEVVWAPGWSKARLGPETREKLRRSGVGL